MPKYEHFEDTPAWKAAAELYNAVLDLFATHSNLFSSSYRNQLDRCSLSVSNNIAEGFERMTTGLLTSFLDIARGSAGETESMMRVVIHRPEMKPARADMQRILNLPDSLVRQLTGWMQSIEHGDVQGKRHLTRTQKASQTQQEKAEDFQRLYYTKMAPSHPLYNSPKARHYRGEAENSQ
jgi:four helix bundle protein